MRVLRRARGRRRRRPRPPPRSRSRSARGLPASPRPRQSSSGARPAQPIATSDCPWRQARPNESVTTIAGATPSSSLRPARSVRADASGSSGSSTTMSAPPAFDASTPAFAHTKPWRVTQISTPRSARSTSTDSSRTTCTWRGILVVLGRQPLRLLAGLDVRQRAHAPLGLGDHLVGHGQEVAGLEPDAGGSASSRRSPRRGRRRAAPRARPAGRWRRAPSLHRDRVVAQQALQRRARGGCAAGVRGESGSAAHRGRRACRRRAPATRPRAPRSPRPRPPRRRRGARGCRARTRAR